MNSDQIKGTIKDAAGGGQPEATLKQAEGKAQKSLGDTKDAVKESQKRLWVAQVAWVRHPVRAF